MPAGATYEPIATSSPTGTNTVTFSSISSSYTDLRIVYLARTTLATTGVAMNVRVNGDSGSNYSRTWITGDGTTASSGRESSVTRFYALVPGSSITSGIFGYGRIDFFNYAGSTNKTILSEMSNDYNGSGSVWRQVQLWRNTVAINEISLTIGSGNFETGSIVTLYGIKAA